MKWDHILSEVALLYVKFLGIVWAYISAKGWVARTRSSIKPPLSEKIFRYALCVIVVSVIGFIAAGIDKVADDKGNYVSTFDYNRGVIVFLVLLFPALLGAANGFTTEEPGGQNEPQ